MASRSPRCSIPTSTWITPRATPKSSRPPRARVLAHAGAANRIGGVDRGLARGDVIKVGRTVELETLDTPGHTRSHVCLLAHGDAPALFCGDTLFNAGAGNCHNGGDPGLLYETFVNQLAQACRCDARVSGPRVHGAQSRLHAGPRARQCRRGARAGGSARARSRACARDHPRRREARERLPAAAESGDHRAAAREVSRDRRDTRMRAPCS